MFILGQREKDDIMVNMETEYEATFLDIKKDTVRQKLKSIGAKLLKPEYLQKRVVFNLPKGLEMQHTWLRVRDEGDKITMSLKITDAGKIENQKEICLEVDDFENAVELLELAGCQKKAYQENKREEWQCGECEITIDEWPFLEPFVEVEATSEQAVKAMTQKLGFDYSKALFCSVTAIYAKKYGLSDDIINNQTPKITFDMENPFLDKNSKN